MSRWSHVHGCFKIFVTPEVLKQDPDTGEKYADIPYPSEQIEFGVPTRKRASDDESAPEFSVDAYIYSLPRATRIIDEMMSDFPSGENEKIQYFLSQTRGSDCRIDSSSYGKRSLRETETIYKEFEKKFLGHYRDFSGLRGVDNFKCRVTHEVEEVVLTISDDLRYCDGVDFFKAMETFLSKLCALGIYLDDGVLTLVDEWSVYTFNIRVLGSSDIEFSLRSRKTNKIVAKKIFEYVYSPDGHTLQEKSKSRYWDSLIKH